MGISNILVKWDICVPDSPVVGWPTAVLRVSGAQGIAVRQSAS